MAKRTSAWVPLAVALVASLVYGGADDTAAYAAGYYQKAYDLWRPLADRGDARALFDPGLMYGEGLGVAKDDAQVVKWDRLATNQDEDMADEVKVSTALVADGKAIQVVVAMVLPINQEVVWEVLNDYENMPRFVPDILATRLISAGPGRKRVEIEGVARLLFMEYPTNTTLDVVHPPRWIHCHQFGGRQPGHPRCRAGAWRRNIHPGRLPGPDYAGFLAAAADR